MPLPKDLPPDRTMTSLGWLIHGTDVINQGDTLLVQMPAGGVWCVLNGELQHLEDKGWVDLSEDLYVAVTEKGMYWYNKWRGIKVAESFRKVGWMEDILAIAATDVVCREIMRRNRR